ncbi:MAG: response regulator, partial [Burkholderiales bacterium]|nr:response regulator [Burkholderiales bacterium]
MAQILIVEPDLGLRNWCRMHLVTAGHEVTAVDDARRALKVSNDRPPDLIIIDTELANAGAFALAANLRAATRTADIPIIFAVPADDAAAIAQASAIAPGRVLTKPFARTALVETVTTRLTEGSPAAADRAPAGTAAASQDAPARPALRQQLSMETKTASVLVVTLRNLVSMARSLRMKSLDPLLQRFLGEARDAINAQGGWVVRIDATGLIALFENSPHEARSHASLAIESALNIVVAARRVKRWGEAALDEPFTPDLSVGCGVHSGEVIVARLA